MSMRFSSLFATAIVEGHCPCCTGRGWIFNRDFTASACPCGGSEEDRIDLSDDIEATDERIPQQH